MAASGWDCMGKCAAATWLVVEPGSLCHEPLGLRRDGVADHDQVR